MTEKNAELNRPRSGFAANPSGAGPRTVVVEMGRMEVVIPSSVPEGRDRTQQWKYRTFSQDS